MDKPTDALGSKTPRTDFEDAAYGQYFLSTIHRNPNVPQPRISGCMDFVSSATKTQAEFVAKDATGNYTEPSLNAAWWAWQHRETELSTAISDLKAAREEVAHLKEACKIYNVALKMEREDRENEKVRIFAAFDVQYKQLDSDLRPKLKDANSTLQNLEKKLEQSRQESAKLREDARRYRWLRLQYIEVYRDGIKGSRGPRIFKFTGMDALDFGIDAALQSSAPDVVKESELEQAVGASCENLGILLREAQRINGARKQ